MFSLYMWYTLCTLYNLQIALLYRQNSTTMFYISLETLKNNFHFIQFLSHHQNLELNHTCL